MFEQLSPTAWARAQFGGANLGDKRRSARLVQLASSLAAKPSGTLPPAMPGHSELQAAYRFLRNPRVNPDAVLEPHRGAVGRAMAAAGDYLLIEDTTSLDFSLHFETDGLGRIGDDGGRGFFVHTTLAVKYSPAPEVLGVYAQKVWARGDNFRCKGRPKNERLARPRESQRWAQKLPTPAPQTRVCFVADREADIYECLRRCVDNGIDFVIRACQSRALIDDERLLFEAAAQAKALGRIQLSLRARPGKPARRAELTLRATRCTLRPPYRPQGRDEPLAVTVLEAREDNGELLWLLLTSREIANEQQAAAMLEIYRCRWLVEEYHKALKTGCRMEASQLASGQALRVLLSVLSAVAARLLGMKLVARSRPDEEPPQDVLGPYGLKVLGLKSKVERWTWRRLIVEIARLGGFLARKGDGDPGWMNIWRGFNDLKGRIETAETLLA